MVSISVPRKVRQVVVPSRLCSVMGILTLSIEGLKVFLAEGRVWRGDDDEVIQIVTDPRLVKVPIKGVCHRIKDLRGRMKPEGQHLGRYTLGHSMP